MPNFILDVHLWDSMSYSSVCLAKRPLSVELLSFVRTTWAGVPSLHLTNHVVLISQSFGSALARTWSSSFHRRTQTFIAQTFASLPMLIGFCSAGFVCGCAFFSCSCKLLLLPFQVHEGEHLGGTLQRAPQNANLRNLVDLGKHLAAFAKERSETVVLSAFWRHHEHVGIVELHSSMVH